jgi:hypothetical protein
MYDIRIERIQHPENLALIGEALGGAGVNINGLSLTRAGGQDIIHLAVDDAGPAERALEVAGIGIARVSEVYVLDKDRKHITGRPGNFGGVCRVLAGHGIGIDFGYPAENNRFIFGVDNLAKARELLG